MNFERNRSIFCIFVLVLIDYNASCFWLKLCITKTSNYFCMHLKVLTAKISVALNISWRYKEFNWLNLLIFFGNWPVNLLLYARILKFCNANLMSGTKLQENWMFLKANCDRFFAFPISILISLRKLLKLKPTILTLGENWWNIVEIWKKCHEIQRTVVKLFQFFKRYTSGGILWVEEVHAKC